MSEEYLYRKGSVAITPTRAVLGSKTYALANITSVEIGKRPPNNAIPAGGIMIGIVMLFFGLLAGSGGSIGYVVAGMGIVLIGLSIFGITKNKPKYLVRIGSASGEKDVLESTNEARIREIVNAINDAIVQRG